MKFFKPMLLICALLLIAPVVFAAENSLETDTVAEVIEAGGYVYLKLEDRDAWIATSPFAVSVGDQIEYVPGMEMTNFESKSLGRTFESIFFVQGARLAGQGTEQATTKQGQGYVAVQPQKTPAAQAPSAGEITPLEAGKTIVQVYAESAQLKEQKISLNARVIKISKNIMGKHWVTLQDGTGTEPDNKLLATTQELVSPGDLVTATGIVRTDIDLGYGYHYKVLLEEATFSPGLE